MMLSRSSESDVLSAETETTWQYLVRDIECEVTVYNTWKDAAELPTKVSLDVDVEMLLCTAAS